MTDQALALLKEKYGTEFGANAVKEVAKELNTSYATLSNDFCRAKPYPSER